MFALSLVDILSLLCFFYFCQKYHLKDTYKIFRKFHVGLKFEWGLKDQYWLSCERLAFEVFLSCLCDGPLGIAYANMLATTQWPLERASHLTSLVWVCILWLPESLMDLSVLCIFLKIFSRYQHDTNTFSYLFPGVHDMLGPLWPVVYDHTKKINLFLLLPAFHLVYNNIICRKKTQIFGSIA